MSDGSQEIWKLGWMHLTQTEKKKR